MNIICILFKKIINVLIIDVSICFICRDKYYYISFNCRILNSFNKKLL